MIRRPPRSTPLYSSAASDVYKRQIYNSGQYHHSEFHRTSVSELATCHMIQRTWLNYDKQLLNYKVKLGVRPRLLYVLIPPFDSRGLQRNKESHTTQPIQRCPLQHVNSIWQEMKNKMKKGPSLRVAPNQQDKQVQNELCCTPDRTQASRDTHTHTVARLGVTQQTSEE